VNVSSSAFDAGAVTVTHSALVATGIVRVASNTTGNSNLGTKTL
jgi:hypothetical protein